VTATTLHLHVAQPPSKSRPTSLADSLNDNKEPDHAVTAASGLVAAGVQTLNDLCDVCVEVPSRDRLPPTLALTEWLLGGIDKGESCRPADHTGRRTRREPRADNLPRATVRARHALPAQARGADGAVDPPAIIQGPDTRPSPHQRHWV